jgi:hypothetical protein
MKASILIFISLFTLLSCTKPAVEEPASAPVPTPTNPLFATWSLLKFSHGFPPYYNYNGEIKWTFNANSTVDVAILAGTTVSLGLPLNTAGNYTYAINGGQITLDNKAYDYVINNNTLTIQDQNGGAAADGRLLKFNKVP